MAASKVAWDVFIFPRQAGRDRETTMCRFGTTVPGVCHRKNVLELIMKFSPTHGAAAAGALLVAAVVNWQEDGQSELLLLLCGLGFI